MKFAQFTENNPSLTWVSGAIEKGLDDLKKQADSDEKTLLNQFDMIYDRLLRIYKDVEKNGVDSDLIPMNAGLLIRMNISMQEAVPCLEGIGDTTMRHLMDTWRLVLKLLQRTVDWARAKVESVKSSIVMENGERYLEELNIVTPVEPSSEQYDTAPTPWIRDGRTFKARSKQMPKPKGAYTPDQIIGRLQYIGNRISGKKSNVEFQGSTDEALYELSRAGFDPSLYQLSFTTATDIQFKLVTLLSLVKYTAVIIANYEAFCKLRHENPDTPIRELLDKPACNEISIGAVDTGIVEALEMMSYLKQDTYMSRSEYASWLRQCASISNVFRCEISSRSQNCVMNFVDPHWMQGYDARVKKRSVAVDYTGPQPVKEYATFWEVGFDLGADQYSLPMAYQRYLTLLEYFTEAVMNAYAASEKIITATTMQTAPR